MNDSLTIMPLAMERAVLDLREISTDSDAFDLLFRYLELARPTLGEIKSAVCEFYGIPLYNLDGRCREYEVSLARQIFCFLGYRYTRFSMAHVGRQVGLKDHSTVSHAVRKIRAQLITRPVLADDIDLLRLRISEKILLRESR